LAKFAKKYDIIFLQETKLLALESKAKKTILSNHEVTFSNNPSNTGAKASTYTAGVCTAISRKISKDYNLKTIALPSSLQGHCLVTLISLPGTDFSLKLINIRLLTPELNKLGVQEQMIGDLRGALSSHPSKYTIMGGDFNFVERGEDTTSEFKVESRPQWELFKEEHSLVDCANDLHSFFHKAGAGLPKAPGVQRAWSARLDRFYISHSEADLTVVKPVVVSDVDAIFARGARGVNAHVPTSLQFFTREKKIQGPRRICESTIANPKFTVYTKKAWEASCGSHPNANALEKLQFLTDAMQWASKKIFFEHKQEINKVVLFQKAVSLFRFLSNNSADDRTFLRMIKGTPLRVLVSRNDDGLTWNTTKLKKYIDISFKVAGVPDCNEEFDHGTEVTAAVPPLRRSNALQELKFKLPSTRTKIEVLRVGPDKVPSADPADIGPLIRDHYEKIWKTADCGPDRQEKLHDYLRDYDRRIDPEDVLDIDLELVQKAIHMAPTSSPGPDGVPFSAFKANIALAGPVLLEVCLFLGVKRDAEAIGSFNFANLFLLPKKETLEINDTRPISVNNAGNRLVARVLFLAVADASQKLIGDYQKMFLPTRRMSDHLRSLNAKYYQMVQDKLDYFVLFTDNAKAFDSIHHDFILASLNKQGFPGWFINAVHNLLTAVRVSPTLAPDFFINIGRGVKQGCPLSPLLFILCYDVLNFKLAPLDNVVVKAAADDLAIETNSIEDVVRAFPIIDSFTVASGLGINRDKTVILCAKDCSHRAFRPTLSKIQSSRWPLVKVVDSHKYLGILIGRTIQVEDVYAAPALKALERARRFGPALRNIDTQRRILVFNVFVTPIFSFVQQFYTMPSSVLREYRSVMRRAISPFWGTAWPYSQLCAPTSRMGFRQPLRDPWVHGMTAILKNIDFSNINSAIDLPWNLDGTFRAGQRKTSNWDSPIFSDHVSLLLMEFLGPGFLNWDGLSQLPKLDAASIRVAALGGLIVSYGVGNSVSYTQNFGFDHTQHLCRRLARFGSSDSDILTQHFNKLPRKVPAFLITHFIKLVCGALNSDGERRRKFDPGGSVHTGSCVENPFPCYLCNRGDVTLPGDGSKHLFGSCNSVKIAWDGILNNSRGPSDVAWTLLYDNKVTPLFIPDFPLAEPNAGYNRLSLTMAFCWAVHKTIDQIKMGRSAEGAESRIITLTLSLKNIWAPPMKASNKSPN
jgi:hypothetical protein